MPWLVRERQDPQTYCASATKSRIDTAEFESGKYPHVRETKMERSISSFGGDARELHGPVGIGAGSVAKSVLLHHANGKCQALSCDGKANYLRILYIVSRFTPCMQNECGVCDQVLRRYSIWAAPAAESVCSHCADLIVFRFRYLQVSGLYRTMTFTGRRDTLDPHLAAMVRAKKQTKGLWFRPKEPVVCERSSDSSQSVLLCPSPLGAGRRCGKSTSNKFRVLLGPVLQDPAWDNWMKGSKSAFWGGPNSWCNMRPDVPEADREQPEVRCNCYDGAYGQLCERPIEPFCLNHCSSRGMCQHGHCACHAGFYGADCSLVARAREEVRDVAVAHPTAGPKVSFQD